MKILNRLPYSTEPTSVNVDGAAVHVRPYQIVVWASLNLWQLKEWDVRVPCFPAILDTVSVTCCAGQAFDRKRFPHAGRCAKKGNGSPVHAATLWLHGNIRGTAAVDERDPDSLAVKDGIAIYPDDTGPRLPLLGLRALTRNRLRCVVDGDRSHVTLRTAVPRWWLFG